jgi:hypothetical protein
MGYFFQSIKTFSYWRYALFSGAALEKILSVMGILYLFINLLDTFQIYAKSRYSQYEIVVVVLFAVIIAVLTRRPVSRIRYKIPKKDFAVEVKIGDIFKENGEIVVSSNTTFDTDLSSGLISPNSLQGQCALRMFKGNTLEIDRQLSESLKQESHSAISDKQGKHDQYEIGTVARVHAQGKNFYFIAMSELNEFGTAKSSVELVDQAIKRLWLYMTERGELGNIVMPLMGTGRGRIEMPRKKMIERIAQSFTTASRDKIFSNKLIIVIHPSDVERFGINLFEVKDYLSQSLHV